MQIDEINNISDEGKAQLAVAFLLKKKDERPEGSEHLFVKLEKFDEAIRTVISSIVEMRESIKELQGKHEYLNGAISTVVELIVEGFMKDKEQIFDWCKRFEPPKNLDEIRPKNVNKNSKQPDMAGATAKSFKAQPPAQN